MDTTHLFPIPEPEAVSRALEDQTVLVLPQRGVVNVLNELGQFVWLRVDGRRSVEAIVADVCAEYDVAVVQARQDVLDFLKVLADKGALRLESRP